MKDFPCGEIKEEKGIQARIGIFKLTISISRIPEDGGHALRPGRDQLRPEDPAQPEPGGRGARHLQQPLLRPGAGHGVRQVRSQTSDPH